jgi:hypothetical protein
MELRAEQSGPRWPCENRGRVAIPRRNHRDRSSVTVGDCSGRRVACELVAAGTAASTAAVTGVSPANTRPLHIASGSTA